MFYNCDCIEGAKKYLPDNSIDLIITDPPYGIDGNKLDKHYNRNENNVIEGYVEIPKSEYADFTEKWIGQAERVLKPGGSIYIVSGYTNLRHILNSLANTKLIEKNHIIWKYNFGVYTSKKFISSHYHILYYVKPGEKPTFNTFAFYSDSEKSANGGSLNYQDREDVWIINREYKPGKIKNKNELPKALLSKMILYSSNPNDLICDFFLGSFATAKVAIALGRKARGFEINSDAFLYQIKQIKNIQPGCMLDELREVPPNKMTNRGKSFNSNEIINILKDFKILINSGQTKKSAINSLSEKYGRGYWSILKIIDGTTNKSSGNKNIDTN
ncbi:MAG TPA: site-specific DNA-methyltransferase [Spirochaetota bacterium]|jgi:site-specific DNA-methyltransferase (adenine-specific)|nr:MAG: DNA adenine methyltransferase YhdJ [Spirochaetes bacterium ADurb.Bin133]HNZ27946.1 site-specific DNA-methyltransferase [Spirochaetota bacterium]HPY87284.1 site-specific DNA-methyltransferase [Spirochaetota bacterium]